MASYTEAERVGVIQRYLHLDCFLSEVIRHLPNELRFHRLEARSEAIVPEFVPTVVAVYRPCGTRDRVCWYEFQGVRIIGGA